VVNCGNTKKRVSLDPKKKDKREKKFPQRLSFLKKTQLKPPRVNQRENFDIRSLNPTQKKEAQKRICFFFKFVWETVHFQNSSVSF